MYFFPAWRSLNEFQTNYMGMMLSRWIWYNIDEKSNYSRNVLWGHLVENPTVRDRSSTSAVHNMSLNPVAYSLSTSMRYKSHIYNLTITGRIILQLHLRLTHEQGTIFNSSSSLNGTIYIYIYVSLTESYLKIWRNYMKRSWIRWRDMFIRNQPATVIRKW